MEVGYKVFITGVLDAEQHRQVGNWYFYQLLSLSKTAIALRNSSIERDYQLSPAYPN
jgi:hypothetical protein